MPGPGRPTKRPSITHVRELTPDDLSSFRQGRDPPIKRYRDSHHEMARLFAMGMRVGQVAETMGYSISRVSVHYNNPTFKELIAGYTKVKDDLTRDQITAYNALILSNGMKAERKIADKLDDDENDELSIRELLSITRDAADRVGLSKRSLQTNISVDFAAMLDKAIERSGKVITTEQFAAALEPPLTPALPRSADLTTYQTTGTVVGSGDRGTFKRRF